MTMEELCQKHLRTSDIAKILDIAPKDVVKYKAIKQDTDETFVEAIKMVKEIAGLDHRTAKRIINQIKTIYKIKD